MTKLFQPPSDGQLAQLIGESLIQIWTRLCQRIENKYDMERAWNSGGKAWVYEYKYRRGGKTLCALYAKGNRIGFMLFWESKSVRHSRRFKGSLNRRFKKFIGLLLLFMMGNG